MSILIQKWYNISSRERRIIIWGAIALLVIGYYGIILSPLLKDRKRLENRLSAEKQLYEQTRQQAQKLVNLGLTGNQAAITNMPASLEMLSKKYALYSNQLDPITKNTLQIGFQSINPNDFFAWLNEIRSIGLSIKQFSIIKDEGQSTIDVEIQLSHALNN